jgi:phage-related protein
MSPTNFENMAKIIANFENAAEKFRTFSKKLKNLNKKFGKYA